MYIIELPIEIMCHIINFLDIPTIEKLIKILTIYKNKNIKVFEIFLKSKIQNETSKKISFILNTLLELENKKQKYINSIIKYRETQFYNFFINNIENKIREIEESPRTNFFIKNEYINFGYQATKEDILEKYNSKLAIIKHGKNYNMKIEQAMTMYSKDYYSYPYSVTIQAYMEEIETNAYQKMLNSHVDNCICRNIHMWCKGLYCEGCIKCKLIYPSIHCLHIQQMPCYG